MTTKIHACVDALGNPVRLILTGGQVNDVTQGAALIEAIPTGAVIADKGYDCDALVGIIEATNLIQRFFNRLKQFRRIATRYDKLACRFNVFLHLVSAYFLLLST